MSCLGDDQLAALALGDPGAAGAEHLAGCAACAARLARMEAILRLGAEAHRIPAPGLSALENEPMPALPSTLEIILMDRRTWAAGVLAAALLLYATLANAPMALADALKPFKDAEGFSCEMVTLLDGKPAESAKRVSVSLAWAAPGSLRSEIVVDGKPLSTAVMPHGKPGIVIDHHLKTYTRLDKPGVQEAALMRMIAGLGGDVVGDAKPAGHDDINGVKSARFDLKAGVGASACVYRLWADPKTKRPVRVEAGMLLGQKLDGNGTVIRLEKFEWGKKAAGSFDVTPPKGYTDTAVKENVADVSARKIVAALAAYKAAKGGYPKTEPFDAVAAAKDLGKKADAKTTEGLVLIGVLQATSKEAIYRGKAVGPDDKERVLFRWKAEDGMYRVILGDLRTVTVDEKRLKKIEK